MADEQAVVAEHGHHEGGAHAGVLRVRVGGVEDGAVRVVDADVHRTPHLGVGRLGAGLAQPAAELGADEAGRHVAGDFTGVVAAHAVGQHGQGHGVVKRDRVFVVAP